MIRFLTSDQIVKQNWDDLIHASQFPTIFATYDFLTIASKQWGALIFNDYEACMPLPFQKKFGIQYIYTPPFISRLGIFSKIPVDDLLVASFMKSIPKKNKLIELILNPTIPLSTQQNHTSFFLDLKTDYDILYQNYSENTRRNLKTAAKHNLRLTQEVSTKEITQLFINNRAKNLEHPIPFAHYTILEHLAHFSDTVEKLLHYGVIDPDGNLIAGALFLKDANRFWFWFSGRDNTNFEKRAMFFLIDQMIQQQCNSSIVLDFNGSNNPNIARFYAGFGATSYTCPYYQKYDPLTNLFIKWYKKWKK